MTVAELVARILARQYHTPDGAPLKGSSDLAELAAYALEGEEARRHRWSGDRPSPAAPESDGCI